MGEGRQGVVQRTPVSLARSCQRFELSLGYRRRWRFFFLSSWMTLALSQLLSQRTCSSSPTLASVSSLGLGFGARAEDGGVVRAGGVGALAPGTARGCSSLARGAGGGLIPAYVARRRPDDRHEPAGQRPVDARGQLAS